MMVFAHAGHWLAGLVYLVPLLAVAAFVVYHDVRRQGGPDRAAPTGAEVAPAPRRG